MYGINHFCRKALNLIHYLLHENSSDCNVVRELGFPRIMMHLASKEDAGLREGALRGLLELAQDKTGGGSDGLGGEDEKLKQVLEERIKDIGLMSADDLGAVREERHLVDSLWNACYNEPSPLREEGLLVLPGDDDDDVPPPDVASKHFEPPLRAWTANQEDNRAPDTDTENKEAEATATPLLLGFKQTPNSQSSNSSGGEVGDGRGGDNSQGKIVPRQF